LARVGFEFYIVRGYREGNISLCEAAKLLNLTLSETFDLIGDLGVRGNIRSKDVLTSI
jgi:hypothetical protein